MTLWKIPSRTVESVQSQVYVGPVFTAAPCLCYALLIRASFAIVFYYSRSLALQGSPCTAHRMALSYVFFFSPSCPPLLTYVSKTSCCLSDPHIVDKFECEFECALFCCGVFHVAHLLHVEMRLRYLMW